MLKQSLANTLNNNKLDYYMKISTFIIDDRCIKTVVVIIPIDENICPEMNYRFNHFFIQF